MLVNDLIDTTISPVYSDEAVKEALSTMKEQDSALYPVADRDSGKLVGVISAEELSKHVEEERVGNLIGDSGEIIKTTPAQHIFEVAGLMIRNKLHLMPVVDRDDRYLGVLRKKEVFDALTEMLNLSEKGSVITLEVGQNDYVLSEIIRIIETEGARVLGVTVESPADPNENLHISLKLNLSELSPITSSLIRHGYTITSQSRDEMVEMEFEQRADEFLKYLEI